MNYTDLKTVKAIWLENYLIQDGNGKRYIEIDHPLNQFII